MKKGTLVLSRTNRVGIGYRCIIKHPTSDRYVVAEMVETHLRGGYARVKWNGGLEVNCVSYSEMYDMEAETLYVDVHAVQHSYKVMNTQWELLLNDDLLDKEVEFIVACFEHGRVYAVVPMPEN